MGSAFLPNEAPSRILTLLNEPSTMDALSRVPIEEVLTIFKTQETTVRYVRTKAKPPVAARDFLSRVTVTYSDDGTITQTSIPEPSVVRASPPNVIRGESFEQWILRPQNGGTLVTFEGKQSLNGWIPWVVSSAVATRAAGQLRTLAELVGGDGEDVRSPSCCWVRSMCVGRGAS